MIYGVYKDLTRHRLASFSIESTRYNAYNKDKFDGQLRMITPLFYTKDKTKEKDYALTTCWENAITEIESSYMEMAKIGAIPDEMRMILPHSTAAKVTMTANIREWKHILSLRCTKYTHPSVQQIMIPLLLEFQKTMPEIFGNVLYNTEFDNSLYAKINIGKE